MGACCPEAVVPVVQETLPAWAVWGLPSSPHLPRPSFLTLPCWSREEEAPPLGLWEPMERSGHTTLLPNAFSSAGSGAPQWEWLFQGKWPCRQPLSGHDLQLPKLEWKKPRTQLSWSSRWPFPKRALTSVSGCVGTPAGGRGEGSKSCG